MKHQSGAVRLIAKGADWLMALCPTVNAQVLDELCGLPIGTKSPVWWCTPHAPGRPIALLAERGIEASPRAAPSADSRPGGRQQ